MSDGRKRSRRRPGGRGHGKGRPAARPGDAEGRRTRGGQPDNTNALKHGLYSRALPPAAQQALQEARGYGTTDLTEEIATLRARLSALSPSDVQALLSGFKLLSRLVATHYRISPQQTSDLAESMADTLRQLGLSLYPPEGVE